MFAHAGAAQSLVAPGARQLVIPFENTSRHPQGQWLTEGSAVLLADDLNALGARAITRDARLAAFEQLRVPPIAALSHATVIRIGNLLGAAQVVLGGFDLDGDDIVVRARAIRLDTGRLFPEIVERGRLTDLFAIYERIAQRLLPGARAQPSGAEPPPLEAFEQYVKGLLAEAPAEQIALLNQALTLASGFQRPRLALWAVHTGEGAHRQALNMVQQVPDGHPQSRRARFLGTLSMMSLGEYQRAFDALTALNEERPDSTLLNNLGIVQLRRPPGNRSDGPTFYFRQAAAADQQDPDAFFNLGYASWLERDTAGTIAALREAVRRNPADDAAHYVLGVALQTAGSVAEAAREKELARRLSSTYTEWEAKVPGANSVPRGLERLRTLLQDDEPGLDDVMVAVGQQDQRALAEFHLAAGRRLLEAERDTEAIPELRRAIFLSPYESEAHLLLGRAYLRSGRVEDAVNALKISLWSEDTEAAHLALAEAHIQAREDTEARAELQKVLARDPGNAEALRLLATLP